VLLDESLLYNEKRAGFILLKENSMKVYFLDHLGQNNSLIIAKIQLLLQKFI